MSLINVGIVGVVFFFKFINYVVIFCVGIVWLLIIGKELFFMVFFLCGNFNYYRIVVVFIKMYFLFGLN